MIGRWISFWVLPIFRCKQLVLGCFREGNIQYASKPWNPQSNPPFSQRTLDVPLRGTSTRWAVKPDKPRVVAEELVRFSVGIRSVSQPQDLIWNVENIKWWFSRSLLTTQKFIWKLKMMILQDRYCMVLVYCISYLGEFSASKVNQRTVYIFFVELQSIPKLFEKLFWSTYVNMNRELAWPSSLSLSCFLWRFLQWLG